VNIEVLPAAKLTAEHFAAWLDILRVEPSLDSPYFRPEFTQAVAAVRDDVQVALIEDGGELVGFFPFQRSRGNVALPIGGKLSDFQGAIVRKGASWDARQLLRGCGLAAWHFDHLLAAQEPFRPYHWTCDGSPYIDLSNGWDDYHARLMTEHANWCKRNLRRLGRARREAGPIRVEIHTNDRRVFQKMLQWKVDQYKRTRVPNVLAYPWSVALLERVLAERGEGFSGEMSALYFSGILSAVLLSMRSHGVLHAWFSAYDPSIGQLSPGLVLWFELLKALPALGVRRVDLGRGREDYKQRLMSGATAVAEGSVDLRPLTSAFRRNWRRAYDWARRSPLRRPLLAPAKMVRSVVGRRNYR